MLDLVNLHIIIAASRVSRYPPKRTPRYAHVCRILRVFTPQVYQGHGGDQVPTPTLKRDRVSLDVETNAKCTGGITRLLCSLLVAHKLCSRKLGR